MRQRHRAAQLIGAALLTSGGLLALSLHGVGRRDEVVEMATTLTWVLGLLLFISAWGQPSFPVVIVQCFRWLIPWRIDGEASFNLLMIRAQDPEVSRRFYEALG